MSPRSFLAFIATLALTEAAFAKDGELNREVRWRGDSTAEQVRVMSFLRTTDGSFAQRTLLEFPPETHLVIAKTTNPLSGEVAYLLRSDESGWWLRWSSTYAVGASNLKDYFNRYSEAEETFNGTQRAVHQVSTSSGFAFETPIVLTSDSEGMMEDLYTKVASGGKQALLAGQIPREIIPSLHFVYCTQQRLDSGVPYLRHVVHFVFRILGEPVGEMACRNFSAEPLPEQRLPRFPALSPEALGFISRFRTVENTDPFQDRQP